MKNIAVELGFEFNRKGCPCNGSPDIYKKAINNKQYTLTIWERRDYWTLKVSGFQVAWGEKENMKSKILEIWA